MIEEPSKRYFHDSKQKEIFEENRKEILKAYEELLKEGETPTPVRIRKKTGICRKTIYKHLKDIEETSKEPEPDEDSFEAFLGTTLEGFISEMDAITREMKDRLGKMSSFTLLFHRNLPLEVDDRVARLRPIFQRRIDQLMKSMTIRTRANQKSWFFEEEMQRQLMRPLIKLFYVYFYGLGLDKTPEQLKCRITIEFDPLKGTMKLLEEQIKLAEWRLINRRHVQDFNDVIDQLVKDDVEHYRLAAIARKTFDERSFERFKKIAFKTVKNRIMGRLRKEGMDSWAHSEHWEPRLRSLLDNYVPSPPEPTLEETIAMRLHEIEESPYTSKEYANWGITKERLKRLQRLVQKHKKTNEFESKS